MLKLKRTLAKELGAGNKKPEVLEKLAQYEITLLDWVEAHRGYREFVAIAGKCWPAFQTQFGFVPCYVNSRLTKMGIPVSCEVDIYGCLSEFIGTVVSNDTVTLLDINNTVPQDIYDEDIKGKHGTYTIKDTLWKHSFYKAFILRDEVPADYGTRSSNRSNKRNFGRRYRSRSYHFLPLAVNC